MAIDSNPEGNGRERTWTNKRPGILQPCPDFEALLPLEQCLDDIGGVTSDPNLDPTLLTSLMKGMIWNRQLDERLTKLQRQGRIGFHIGSVGEEAVMIGSAAALRLSDWITPCYREMGVALYRGMSLDAILANMYGTADDPVKGRQMPCHYADRERNFLSISSPVGTQITQAVGVAWGAKLRRTSDVVVVYFGDGATSEGDFHLGMNFAGVYQVPVVFICRNNQWAISTPLSAQTASQTIAQKGIGYGVPGERVDGNDVLATYTATNRAVEKARRGEGPTLLEMVTYRQGGHSTSDDPRAYRNQEEVDAWIKKDPISRFRNYLANRKIWSEREEQPLLQEIADRVQAAIEKAERAEKPGLDTLFSDVFAERTRALREQQAELEEALAQGYVPREH